MTVSKRHAHIGRGDLTPDWECRTTWLPDVLSLGPKLFRNREIVANSGIQDVIMIGYHETKDTHLRETSRNV